MYANSASSHFSLRWSMIIAFNILVIYPVRVIPQGASCPRKCQCIWRDSKITVDCSDKSLAGIPTTVETNTQGMLIFIMLLSPHKQIIFLCIEKTDLHVCSTDYTGRFFVPLKHEINQRG